MASRLGRILWSAVGQKLVFVLTAATGILHWLGELGLTANTFAVAWLICSAPIVIWLIAGLLKEANRAMKENARKNGVADWLFVTQEVAKTGGAVDIVIANNLAEPPVKIPGRSATESLPVAVWQFPVFLPNEPEAPSTPIASGSILNYQRQTRPGFVWPARGFEWPACLRNALIVKRHFV